MQLGQIMPHPKHVHTLIPRTYYKTKRDVADKIKFANQLTFKYEGNLGLPIIPT